MALGVSRRMLDHESPALPFLPPAIRTLAVSPQAIRLSQRTLPGQDQRRAVNRRHKLATDPEYRDGCREAPISGEPIIPNTSSGIAPPNPKPPSKIAPGSGNAIIATGWPILQTTTRLST